MTIPQDVVGQRISTARKRAGMTQEALSKALGVPRSGVAALEAGNRTLKAEELYILAEVLGKPMSYFVRREVREVDFQPLYRLFDSTESGRVAEAPGAYAAAVAQPQLARFQGFCERWVELLGLAESAPPEVPRPPSRAAGGVPPSALADWVRDRIGLDDAAPALSLRVAIEDRMGVQVFMLAPDDSDFSGASLHDAAAGACIAIARTSGARMRFAMAHELAHLLVHQGQAHACGHDVIRAHETYASNFAAELLMPARGVRQRSAEFENVENPVAVQRLAWQFQVSFSAMADRLERLKLLPRGWYGELCTAVGVEPSDAVRSVESEVWPELPERFRLLALELYDGEQVSTGRYAELTGVDLDIAIEQLQGFRQERWHRDPGVV